MRILKGFPPNYVQIRKAFPEIAKYQSGIIFTYGQTIYIPSGRSLTPSLLSHETAHCAQQGAEGPARWWERYIEEIAFRLSQELEAHQVEWEVEGRDGAYLKDCAARLASGIYRLSLSPRDAERLIKGGSS